MAKRSKRYQQIAEGISKERRYTLDEALQLVRERATAKFDEAVDVAIKLGIDPRQTDQRVRGTVVLPHGTGKVPRVAVFAQGEAAAEAQEAGADVVGAEDLIERIEQGWDEFDILVATPDMMSKVGRLGRKLGPRMPNRKAGTVTRDVAQTVRELKAGKVQYRNDAGGVVHACIGRASFPPEELRENFVTLLSAILKARPPAAKGSYIRRISLSSTMGPGLPLDVSDALAAVGKS
ncbi:MAG TPA: 50S ribosomal protein L1 [Armatimonadetes bacterium]|nr:50S ribosomal protein L1 [Armatimonadota bacterium]